MSKKSIAIVLIILGIAGLLILYFIKPGGDSFYPKCPARYLTGLNCAGCGTLRALNSLLHLGFKEALRYNLLTVILLPFFIYISIAFIAENLFSKKFPKIYFNKIAWQVLLGLLIIFTVLRNIPIYPFSLFKV